MLKKLVTSFLVSVLLLSSLELGATELNNQQMKGLRETLQETSKSRTQGMALLVGLKEVNPRYYYGWDGASGCWGCELDVDKVDNIVSKNNYNKTILKTAQATKNSILDNIDIASTTLKSGDIFVFYFSGHGGQISDYNNDETDGLDETFCAYDGEIIDDEIHEKLEKFKPGVRIFMLTDNCHSGTNYKNPRTEYLFENEKSLGINAGLIHISGCKDDEYSYGYRDGGEFTKAMVKAWNNGFFSGNYFSFYQSLLNNITSPQEPQYNEYGNVSSEFKSQIPFTI